MAMSGHGSSRRYEVVAETRRRWSGPEKQAIVTEASAPCTNVSAVARRHGISPSLLFRWMKDLKATTPAPVTTFLPVALPVAAASEPLPASEPVKAREVPRLDAGSIEIELANGAASASMVASTAVRSSA